MLAFARIDIALSSSGQEDADALLLLLLLAYILADNCISKTLIVTRDEQKGGMRRVATSNSEQPVKENS